MGQAERFLPAPFSPGAAAVCQALDGLAAGALIGAAVSEAHAAPTYGYGSFYGYEEAPVGYGRAPGVTYRPSGFVRGYGEDEAPAYAGRGWDGGGEGYAPIVPAGLRIATAPTATGAGDARPETTRARGMPPARPLRA